MARASAQAGDGAGALFARLDAADAAELAATAEVDPARASALAADRRRAEAERLLTRWAARIHAGEWSDGIGELVALAQALELGAPASSSILPEKGDAVASDLRTDRRGLPSTN